MAIKLSRMDGLQFTCGVCSQQWFVTEWIGGSQFLEYRYVHCPRCGHKSLIQDDDDTKLGVESSSM
jgi:DNA-directed RNA polymerase subunit RPC12/RpoP